MDPRGPSFLADDSERFNAVTVISWWY